MSSGRRRHVLRGLAVAAFALGAVATSVGIASAHANLVGSEPADGETLQAPPNAVVLTFTEEPERSLSSIRLLDASGSPLPTEAPTVVGGDRSSLTLPLSHLDNGVYTVTWRVVSSVDGHATAGAFSFGIGESPSPSMGHSTVQMHRSPPPSAIEVAGRWAFLAGLVALLGGSLMGLVVLGRTVTVPRWYPMAGWAVAACGLALVTWAQVDAAQVGLASLLSTSIGRGLAWRAAGILAAGVGIVGLAMREGTIRRAWLGVAAAGAAGAALAHVSSGHAAAANPPLAQVAAQWVHLTAVATWIGGLAALLLAIRGEPDADRARAVRRFSTAAGISLAAVVGTGLVRALYEVRSLRGLFLSSYGRLVLVKVGLLAVLAGLGAVNRYRNVPRSGRSLFGLRRVSRIELGVAAAVLGATALLAALSPPTRHTAAIAATIPSRLVAEGSDFATSVRVTLEVEPGQAGSNMFTVRVADYDTKRPVTADRVALRFSYLSGEDVGGSTLDLHAASAGVYEATASSLSIEGIWEVSVLVQRAANSVDVPLVIATPCHAEVMRPEGAPTIYSIELSSEATLQGYVDPGTAGPNQVHLTFFDHEGTELPVEATPKLTAWRPGQDPVDLEVARLGPGHFVANQELHPGRERFEFTADVGGGVSARGCFEQTVRGR